MKNLVSVTILGIGFTLPLTNAAKAIGLYTTQGDQILKADVAREKYGVSGAGIKIGIISDSFDMSTDTSIRASQDVSTGDLPSNYTILMESPTPGTDEGRAMMQIVHDIAPGAQLYFHTMDGTGSGGGAAGLATAIRALTDAGMDIIVDDVFDAINPFFQDGSEPAKAAAAAFNQGIPVFTSAGNYGPYSYQSPFRNSGETLPEFAGGGVLHNFNPDPEGEPWTRISINGISSDSATPFILQWDAPWKSISPDSPGPTNRLDFQLYEKSPSGSLTILSNTAIFPLPSDGDAYTGRNICSDFPCLFPSNILLSITLPEEDQPPDLLKLFVGENNAGVSIQTPDGNQILGSTIVGHGNADSTFTVATTNWDRFNYDSSQLPVAENFNAAYSSRGVTPILFDENGDRLATPIYREKPNGTGVDRVSNTFFGVFLGDDPMEWGPYAGSYIFSGTSAAAPHIAGIAALMMERGNQIGWELSPAQIYELIEKTANNAFLGYENGVFNPNSGYGLVNAELAVGAVPEPLTLMGASVAVAFGSLFKRKKHV